MAFSLNRIMLIGNLGDDAENSFTQNNVSITKFSMATTHGYKGSDGNWVNETTWHNIVAFNLSDFFKEQLKKGKKVYVEGRLQKREYTDKDGIKRYFTDVRLDQLIPLDSRDDNSGGGYSSGPSTPNREPIDSQTEDDDLPF